MGVYEEKEKPAGMDDRSVLIDMRAAFDRLRETADGGTAGLELRAALAAVRDIAGGDFDDATKREARDLTAAALDDFVEEVGGVGNGEGDVPPELAASYLDMASIFESDFPESVPVLAEVSRELRKQMIKTQLRQMSPEDLRRLLSEIAASSG